MRIHDRLLLGAQRFVFRARLLACSCNAAECHAVDKPIPLLMPSVPPASDIAKPIGTRRFARTLLSG